jgi:carboxymethylenebutenolidase
MTRSEISIATPDGDCPATLHVPDGGGPAPAVILYADAGGVRETMRVMADRLAASGYVTLLPDFYYRSGDWAPFDVATMFSDPAERRRLMELVQGVTAEMIGRDAGAFLDFLAERPEVSGTAVGTTGYCMGGRSSLITAGRHPERIGAAASFHGGRLAATDDPDSPYLLADRLRAAVYVAAAQDDDSFPADQFERLEAAFESAGVRYTMEVYPAAHGFAVPDNPTYDPAAEQRHWIALSELFAANLRG